MSHAEELQLSHRDLGGAGLPPLVILHGVFGSSRNWQAAGRDLAARHHVFALDLRNHGSSPHAAAMGFGDMAGDVLAWMDRHGMAAATLLGHSMGGKVAMLLACRHPGRVGRLVVVDIAPRDYAWKGQRTALAAMRAVDLGRVRTRAEAEHELCARVPDFAMRKFLATNLEAAPGGGLRWIVNLDAIGEALGALERNPLGAADRFAGPALFVTGGRSSYVAAADWPGILGHFPAARWEVLPDSGHNPHMDNRPAFVRAVLGDG